MTEAAAARPGRTRRGPGGAARRAAWARPPASRTCGVYWPARSPCWPPATGWRSSAATAGPSGATAAGGGRGRRERRAAMSDAPAGLPRPSFFARRGGSRIVRQAAGLGRVRRRGLGRPHHGRAGHRPLPRQAGPVHRPLDAPRDGGRRLGVYLKRHYRLPWLARPAGGPLPGAGAGRRGWRSGSTSNGRGRRAFPCRGRSRPGSSSGRGAGCRLPRRRGTGRHAAAARGRAAGARRACRRRTFLRWKRGLTAELARLARELHRRGAFHKDLYFCHFYIPEAFTARAAGGVARPRCRDRPAPPRPAPARRRRGGR